MRTLDEKRGEHVGRGYRRPAVPLRSVVRPHDWTVGVQTPAPPKGAPAAGSGCCQAQKADLVGKQTPAFLPPCPLHSESRRALCREARSLPTWEADLGPNPSRQDPRLPNLSRLIGGEPTLPNAQVLGEQVQGKPSSASPRRGRNHRRHLGVEAGARAGKRKFTENQIFFFFFNMNKLFFLKGYFVPIFISGYLKKLAIL